MWYRGHYIESKLFLAVQVVSGTAEQFRLCQSLLSG